MAASGDIGAAVVEAARSGDQRAQDELVAGCLPLVCSIVGRALNGHPDVDDVVQETMLRALRSLGSLADPAKFRSWLVAITMNQIRHHWRDGRSEPASRGLHDAYDVADPGADFVDLTIIRLGLEGQRREVAEATRWLDPDDQALLSLWWLEAAGELTRAEVAAALELSPQHTAVRVQRMKAQLETARLVVRALAAQPRCVLLDETAVARATQPERTKTAQQQPRKKPSTAPQAAPAGSPAAQVLALTNAERSKTGCGPVTADSRLAKAAQLHSEDMSANNYFSHTSQDGRSFADRAKAQGYPSPGAENIAKGQSSAAAVMDAWMNSPGHRANILNCDLKTMGVGVTTSDWTWTQVFGF
ncbi:hypothetical protein GCM10009535_10330 [Streptomyces thermocarboxydovorans]|uniref:RNA polymerase sigma factor n=1 Tax=Streptomyces thermocarboxydovorans TaxID=59298 RepID=A0ABN1HB47_9ACTN